MSTTHMTHAPELTIAQRMEALRMANMIRSYRSQLKRDVKAGRKMIVNLLLSPPDEIEAMKIFDLLLAVPKVGRVKANHLLKVCRISSSKTIGGMSERQREELIRVLQKIGCR